MSDYLLFVGGLFFFRHIEPLDQHLIPPDLIYVTARIGAQKRDIILGEVGSHLFRLVFRPLDHFLGGKAANDPGVRISACGTCRLSARP